MLYGGIPLVVLRNGANEKSAALQSLFDEIYIRDIEKRNNLLKFIKSNIQFIITTTDIKNISEKIVEKASIFKIKDGNIINYGRKKNYGTTKTL